VFVAKLGTALAFVLIFYIARGSLSERWLVYVLMWWVMFVVGEIGQAIGPDYTWKEAIVGMVSETIYAPLAAYVTSRLLGAE
jgi:Na+/pantothenate symporter